MSGSPGSEDADEYAAIAELAEAFTELVELFTERHRVSLTADGVVRFAARSMPHAQHTGLTVLDGTRLHSIAGTGPVIEQLDRIRADVGEGPALDVLEVNELVYSGDLLEDPRWPAFGRRAADELGVRSVASYRLYLGRRQRAALTFSSDWPYAFEDVALAIGAIFAAYCSLALFNEVILEDELSPPRAAQVHREIGVAVGILLSAQPAANMDSAQAYRQLHEASRAVGRSVHDVAGHVIEHRQLPARTSRPHRSRTADLSAP